MMPEVQRELKLEQAQLDMLRQLGTEMRQRMQSSFQGLLGGLGAGPAIAAPPPPPKQTTRIKLGGQVVAAKLLAQPQPVYPPLARQARIQGNVVLHAIIDKDGRVGELQVISGHPLLVQSALEAVKNWRYQPTQLNGEPVEVDTTITVSFVLGG